MKFTILNNNLHHYSINRYYGYILSIVRVLFYLSMRPLVCAHIWALVCLSDYTLSFVWECVYKYNERVASYPQTAFLNVLTILLNYIPKEARG